MSSLPGNIAVLGSTGSIGRQTLEVVRLNREQFRVVALAAHSDVKQIVAQAREFSPELVALGDQKAAAEAERELKGVTEVIGGAEAILQVTSHPSVHTVMAAVMGFAGLEGVLRALEGGKHVALANKESLVAGGELVKKALQAPGAGVLVPVDSEHSSIFQCLLGRRPGEELCGITITASGGPFRETPQAEFASVTPEMAVKHPRWNMGAKISVDSATLFNKGLELIEASVLFGLPAEQIHVLVHPQSLVHGLIEFNDGSVLASLSQTSMQVPISFALGYLNSSDPRQKSGSRLKSGVPRLNLSEVGKLEFFEVDQKKFPSISLCYQALRSAGSAPVVLNAANEVAVNAFLRREIGFLTIPELVLRTLEGHDRRELQSFHDVVLADSGAREAASKLVEKLS